MTTLNPNQARALVKEAQSALTRGSRYLDDDEASGYALYCLTVALNAVQGAIDEIHLPDPAAYELAGSDA